MKTPRPRVPILAALCAVAALHAAPPEGSPFAAPQPAFFGQVRPRTEIDHKAVSDTSANKALMNTHLRTRLGFTAAPSPKVEVKVELQDTRTFGSEPSASGAPHTATVGNSKGVDLLQGYVALREGPVKIALGRQKMQLGAGRYLSTLEWSPVSRAFDGLSANWGMKDADLTAFTFLVSDSATSVAGSAPTRAAAGDRLTLSGIHYNRKVGNNLTVEASGFYDQSRLRTVYSGDSSSRYDLYYLGQRTQGAYGLFAFEEEILWQGGTVHGNGSKNSSAWQVALRAGLALPKVKANLGVDAMSGDDDPTDGTTTMYRANYYFSHAYFGWMDYFASNPRYGVVDWRADVDALLWKGESRSASLKAQYHYFTPENAPTGDDDPYGQELDAEVHLSLYPKSNLVIGAATFVPDASAYKLPAAKLARSAGNEPGWFLYVMPTFNF